MGIQNGTVLDGGITATTGGTAKTLTLDGQKVNGGLHVSDASVTDARVRPGVSFTSKPAQYNRATNTWVKQRCEAKLDMPKLLADGTLEFPGFRIIGFIHPEQTDAEILKQISWATQVLNDPDFLAFWKTGALS